MELEPGGSGLWAQQLYLMVCSSPLPSSTAVPDSRLAPLSPYTMYFSGEKNKANPKLPRKILFSVIYINKKYIYISSEKTAKRKTDDKICSTMVLIELIF